MIRMGNAKNACKILVRNFLENVYSEDKEMAEYY
jgi:hypothetical protein